MVRARIESGNESKTITVHCRVVLYVQSQRTIKDTTKRSILRIKLCHLLLDCQRLVCALVFYCFRLLGARFSLVKWSLESQLAVENIQPVKLTPSLHDHRWSVPPPAAMLDPPDVILMVCDPNLTLLFHSSCLLSTQTDE